MIEKLILRIIKEQQLDGKSRPIEEIADKIFKRKRRRIERIPRDRSIPTERELEVLRLLAEEKSNEEIAEKLKIKEHTVESHRVSLRNKSHISSLEELLKWAKERKFIE